MTVKLNAVSNRGVTMHRDSNTTVYVEEICNISTTHRVQIYIHIYLYTELIVHLIMFFCGEPAPSPT